MTSPKRAVAGMMATTAAEIPALKETPCST